MFDRVLLDNDHWLLTLGLLGGITVHLKARNITRKALRQESRHFNDTVEALKKQGVMITPGNPELEEVFEEYAEAVFDRGGVRWQALFLYTPESIVNRFDSVKKTDT